MNQLEAFFHHFTMQLVPHYLHTQLRGVLIDPWERASLKEHYTREIKEAADRLESAAGYRVLAKKGLSRTALLKLLYTDLGLPKQYNRKTGNLSADKEALEKLEKYADDQSTSLSGLSRLAVFQDIFTIRDDGVQLNTFIDSKLDSDGRLRWSNNLAGTTSGRLSTSGSPFWTGTNIQNWNEVVRKMVLADPGSIFVYVDGEQAEARVVAFLSQDPNYIGLFEKGISIHKQMASRIFKVPMDQIQKDTPEYRLAKVGVHAADYDMGVNRAAIVFRKSVSEARAILDAVHKELPGIRSVFHAGVREQINKNRMLVTPFGRRRQFFGRWGNELLKSGYSYVPQGTVGDWCNMGLLRMMRFQKGIYSSKTGSHLDYYLTLPDLRFAKSYDDLKVPVTPVTNQHDGMLAQTTFSNLRAAINLMREAYTFAIPFKSGILTIPVDVKIGTIWGNLYPAKEEYIQMFERGWVEA